MDPRSSLFQRLKPICVALSKDVLALTAKNANLQSIVDRLLELTQLLENGARRPYAFDAKLAEYVFFPLSQILKASQRTSIRILELTLQCLPILIEHGWKLDIQPQLVTQFMILFTLMADGSPKGLPGGQTSNELRANAYKCLGALFTVATKDSNQSLSEEANIPQFGQTISSILDGIEDNDIYTTQATAAAALQTLMKNVATPEIKVAFFPGITSRLSKTLTPKGSQRRHYKVLVACFQILQEIIGAVLHDSNGPSATREMPNGDHEGSAKTENSALATKEWLDKTAEQMLPVITNIARQKTHEREEVKEALSRLCLEILRKCRVTLANCCPLALETIIDIISQNPTLGEDVVLEMLLRRDPTLSDLLQKCAFEWLQSLTRVFSSSDDSLKSSRLRTIGKAYEILVRCETSMEWLDQMLAERLQDCIVMTLQTSGSKSNPPPLPQVQALDIELAENSNDQSSFRSTALLATYSGQETVLSSIDHLVKTITMNTSPRVFTTKLMNELALAKNEEQVATFWLVLRGLQEAFDQNQAIDSFLILGEDTNGAQHQCLQELYSFSLDILAETPGDHIDPRLQALALRALALQAQKSGSEFRHELIDALYPVLQCLASSDQQLRADSITTLNLLTSVCGYDSVKDLIVEHVDYLTNAVALKLNAFDVSPQAPQVLLMAVRLAGPSLLPYLEDTVESIFAALDDYHGYPLLVELLFKVLSVVAEEGAKNPQLAITASEHGLGRREESLGVDDLSKVAQLIKDRASAAQVLDITNDEVSEVHPKRPWKTTADDKIDTGDDEVNGDSEQESHGQEGSKEIDLPPPALKTYKLLLKISELTQHFLPSASQSLRKSLLDLIKITSPPLSKHEDSFLPLINTLWPEVVSRLDDPEGHVVAAALDVIGVLCVNAGDFMRSRIVKLWPALIELHQRISKSRFKSSRNGTSHAASLNIVNIVSSDTSLVRPANRAGELRKARELPQDYLDSSINSLWDSLVGAIAKIVQHASLPPEMLDEALSMLRPELANEEVRSVFEQQNADAVWLVQLRCGLVNASALKVPGQQDRWRFAQLPAITSRA